MGSPTRRGPGITNPGQSTNATAKATNTPKDTREGHLAEADIRLEAVESGLARIALGMESTESLGSYARLVQIARLHLKAA